MEQIKSVIFKNAGEWTEVLEYSLTTINEPAYDEVQIEIMASPINPSDEMFIKGKYRLKPSFPQIAGLEGSGIIVKVGKSIDKQNLGAHVAFRSIGTWTEKINLKLSALRIIPLGIPFEVSCQLSLNTLTSYALLECACVMENQWILLTAANSSVCQQIIQMAKLRNINVIAIVRKDEQKENLLSLGAKLAINSNKLDLVIEVNKYVPNGVNVSIDAVGGFVGSQLFKVAAPLGKIIIYGILSNDATQFFNADIIYKNLNLHGFGIDAWIKTKTNEELDVVWSKIISSILNNTLNVNYDKVFVISNFEEGIKIYKTGGGRIILKQFI